MDDQPLTIKPIQMTELIQHLSSLVNEVARQQTRVLIEKDGIPVAALISADDLRLFTRLEEQRAERFKVIDEIREAFKDVGPEEIERETDRIIANIRAENREQAAETVTRR